MLPGFAARGGVAHPPRLARGGAGAGCGATPFDQALAGMAADVQGAGLPSLEAAFGASLVIMGAENWAALGAWADHPGMGEDVRARLKAGGEQTAEALAGAEAVRAALIAEIDALLDGADALVLPTLPIVPPTLAEAADARAVVPLTRLVRPFNLSGHPAITLPIRTAGASRRRATGGAARGDASYCSGGLCCPGAGDRGGTGMSAVVQLVDEQAGDALADLLEMVSARARSSAPTSRWMPKRWRR
jgi:hypothetical protein